MAENIVEAENDHDYERLFSVVHDDVALYRPANAERGALRRAAEEMYSAFPDHRRHIERLLPGARFVVVQWRFVGTHLGTWGGIEPTGHRVVLNGCSILEFERLRLVGTWCFADTGALLRQLEVAAPTGEPRTLVVVA